MWGTPASAATPPAPQPQQSTTHPSPRRHGQSDPHEKEHRSVSSASRWTRCRCRHGRRAGGVLIARRGTESVGVRGGGGSRGKTRLRGGRQPAPRAYPPFLTSHGLFSTSLSCGQHSSATLWGRSHRPPVNCVSLHAPLQLRLHLRRLPSPASASGAHATRQPPMHTLDARRAHLPSVYCTGMRPARAGRDPPKTDQ